MAIYEYLCLRCQAEFEVMRPMSEADKVAVCPRCGSEGQKLVSGFGSKTGSYMQSPGEPFRKPPGQADQRRGMTKRSRWQGGVDMVGLVKRPCAYCGGRGRLASMGIMPVWKTCVVCDGFKSVLTPNSFVKCQYCSGTGRRMAGATFRELVRCKKCRGTGWAEPLPVTGRQ
jgi:putative FmdB family regulatory protein